MNVLWRVLGREEESNCETTGGGLNSKATLEMYYYLQYHSLLLL